MIYFGDDKMPDLCNRRYPFHYTTALNLLAKMGIASDRIEMIAIGVHENFKGEVRNQKPKPGEPLKGARVVLEIGFPSAVDQMPYQFFYGLYGRTARGSEWERHARQLMAPYDAAVIRHDAAARMDALRFAFGVLDEHHIDRYLHLFDFDLDKKTHGFQEEVVWAAVLPSFHRWAGNPVRVAEALALLFGYRFRIIENVASQYDIPEGIQYRLGAKSGRLGRESVIGRSFSECDSTYEIVVGGLTRKDMVEFLPGKPVRRKLEWVLSVCMPGNLDYRFRFEIDDPGMVLGKDDQGSHLGFSTHLHGEITVGRDHGVPY